MRHSGPSPDIDPPTRQISEAGGAEKLTEASHQIGGSQMRVAL